MAKIVLLYLYQSNIHVYKPLLQITIKIMFIIIRIFIVVIIQSTVIIILISLFTPADSISI